MWLIRLKCIGVVYVRAYVTDVDEMQDLDEIDEGATIESLEVDTASMTEEQLKELVEHQVNSYTQDHWLMPMLCRVLSCLHYCLSSQLSLAHLKRGSNLFSSRAWPRHPQKA